MKNKYFDLIDQSYYFPQEGFDLKNDTLSFHGISLIHLILNLLKEKKIDKKRTIICNGYKTNDYLKKIVALQEMGFSNIIIVLDSKSELQRLTNVAGKKKMKIGIRMA